MTTDSSPRQHWDGVYESTPFDQTGWYEETPTVSLDLIDRCRLSPDDLVVDVGTGASRLVERLLERGYRNVLALDVSQVALNQLAARLGGQTGVRLLAADLSRMDLPLPPGEVALWHDRAALHFLVAPGDRDAYVANLRTAVRPGGHVILATFAPEGADHCSGLPVQRYDARALQALLGDEFELRESRLHTYVQPSGGLRPFVYARFQRRAAAS